MGQIDTSGVSDREESGFADAHCTEMARPDAMGSLCRSVSGCPHHESGRDFGVGLSRAVGGWS
jgi:hypothetical protein